MTGSEGWEEMEGSEAWEVMEGRRGIENFQGIGEHRDTMFEEIEGGDGQRGQW